MVEAKKKMGRPRLENSIIIKHSIRFDKQLDDRMRDYCKAHRVSMGEIVRTAIRAFLDAQEAKKEE